MLTTRTATIMQSLLRSLSQTALEEHHPVVPVFRKLVLHAKTEEDIL